MKTIITQSIIGVLLLAVTQGQADPFTNENAKSKDPESYEQEKIVQKTMRFTIEEFSLAKSEAATLLRKDLSDEQLYAAVVEKISKNEAKQELLTTLLMQSNTDAETNGIDEFVYPTEYEPAEYQNGKKKSDDKNATAEAVLENGFIRPATPTAFEPRNLGRSVNAKLVLSPDEKLCKVNYESEHVRFVGFTHYGENNKDIVMPEFQVERNKQTIVIPLNKIFFAGTKNETPESKLDKDSANTVWFTFVKVSTPKE